MHARGRNALAPIQAKRLRDAIIQLHRDKYEGNASALARDLGLTQSAVSQILSGKNSPGFATAVRMANLTGIAIWEVLGMDQEPPELGRMASQAEEDKETLRLRPNLMAAMQVAIKADMVVFPSAMEIIRAARELPDFATSVWLAMISDIPHAHQRGRPSFEVAGQVESLMADLAALYKKFRDV